MKPTKTSNPLHFEDLDPGRFEGLCLEIVNRYKTWYKIDHYGGVGDEGIDIYTEEKNGDIIKKWVFQCKRYIEIDKTTLKNIVDKININNLVPDVLALIVSCNLGTRKSEFFLKAMQKSIILKKFLFGQN